MNNKPPRKRSGTVEVDPMQILEERLRRPPPLPGSTLEVQAVQILEERATAPGSESGPARLQVTQLEAPEEPASEEPGAAHREEEAPAARVYSLTAGEVDWAKLDSLESDLLLRFTYGATIDAIVEASRVEPERAREAIDRLIRAGLLVS